MKQSVVKQMKDYQSKHRFVRAVQYQEGMEDAWMIIIPDVSAIDEYVDRVFDTKEDAENYTTCPLFTREYGNEEMYDVIPVMLAILADDETEYCSCIVTGDKGFKYEFTALDEDSYLVVDEYGSNQVLDSDDFFDMYESINEYNC